MAAITEREAARIALRALRANRLRSGLTTLGIVIGIAAVIIGVALGNGVQAFFDDVVGPLATQITVRQVTNVAGGRPVHDLTDGDVLALTDRTKAPDINTVIPMVTGSAVLRVAADQRRVNVIGTVPGYFTVTDRDLVAGRTLNDADTVGDTRVAVLGPVPAATLFGGDGSGAVGQVVRLGRQSFTVVGVVTTNSQQDDVAIVPLTAARAYLFGDQGTVDQIIAQATGPLTVTDASAQLERILDERHRISDPTERDFETISLQSLIEQRAQFLDVLRAFIGAVAAISLLVGGIGVANIMLVAVTERTREIGLRRAVGATRSSIMRQFLTESSTLAAVGGLAGVVVGVGLCLLADLVFPRYVPNFPAPVVSPGSVLLAFVISVLIGFIAGGYPAARAARMRPIDALRRD
ncbi:MAG TPA: ABC transporter permease [Pseudonocardia sp.]|nr:ABC transporter permease [Pseudonocardia sp.]